MEAVYTTKQTSKTKENKMKKLMIAAAVISAAVFAEAAAIDWESSIGYISPDAVSGEDAVQDFTLYVFDASKYSMEAFAAAMASDADTALAFFDNALGSATVDGGYVAMSGADFDPVTQIELTGTPEAANAYLVLVSDDQSVYKASDLISIEATAPVKEGGAYFDMDTWAVGDVASWSTVGVAPEPTSGLLLLIGVAGLALRRRRA